MPTPPPVPSRLVELYAPFDGPRLIGGYSDGRVAVCDVQSRQCVSAFDTIFEFGGHRLAIHPAGNVCAAASYDRKTVALYNADSGDLLAQKKGFKETGGVLFSPDGAWLYCSGRDRPLYVLDSTSLDEVAKHRSVDKVCCSPHEEVDMFGKGGLSKLIEIRHRGGEKIAAVERTTFAILSATFAPGRLCITESGGPVRCLEVETGREAWRHTPEPNSHFLRMAYSPSLGAYFGLWWNYRFGGPRLVVRFDPETGAPTLVATSETLGLCPAFCDRSSVLISNDRAIIDLATGQEEAGAMPFPANS